MKGMLVALTVLSVLLLLGCQPAAPAVPAAPAPSEPVAPSEQAADVEQAPAEAEAVPEGPYREIGLEGACAGLLTAEDFESVCGYEGNVVLTPKISAGSCWVNIADQMNNRLTAGFTVVDWSKVEKANSEFDRGVKARRLTQGATESKVVGERSYEYDEISRHNVVWVRGTFLTRLGAMNELCPADKLVALAQKIDAGLH